MVLVPWTSDYTGPVTKVVIGVVYDEYPTQPYTYTMPFTNNPNSGASFAAHFPIDISLPGTLTFTMFNGSTASETFTMRIGD